MHRDPRQQPGELARRIFLCLLLYGGVPASKVEVLTSR